MAPKVSTKSAQTKIVQNNACCVYDFTLFDDISANAVRLGIKELSKKYCFQLEKGEKTGQNHYQGRMSLKIKKREAELAKLLQGKGWSKFHVSPTSTANKNNDFYVCKEETRVDGPFTDENDVYIPRDIREIQKLRPWQETLKTIVNTYNERTVDIIYDNGGNIGKTTLTRYLMLYEDAELLPFCNDYKDIMRMAYDIGPKKAYLVDMPRAINKEKLYQFFSGIETLKSGYCYDDRYKFQRRLFDRPRILVFTNEYPDVSLLSKDMWKIWKVEGEQLVSYHQTPEIKIESKKLQFQFDESEDEYVSSEDERIGFDKFH